MQKPRVAFLPIARTTFDIELAQQVTNSAREHLAKLPVTIINSAELITDLQTAQQIAQSLASTPPDLLLVFQATFADSSIVTSLAEIVDAPLMLWAIPEDHTGGRLRLNSLCGINLAGHALRRTRYQYGYVFAAPEDPSALGKICTLAKAGYARNVLRQSRLGRVGDHPEGFETCLFDKELIQSTFGLKVEQFDLINEIFPLARQIQSSHIDTLQAQLNEKVVGLEDLDPTPTRGTLSVYAALKQLAQQRKLGGLAVRCWPEFFTDLGCAACGAMSMLSDELIPCSCEADVNGTLTQMILQALSTAPAFGTDIVSLDEERDALVIWHCGLAPLSMADPAGQTGVTIHSNRRLPLLFEFSLKPGLVTVARLTQSSGAYRLVIGQGEILPGPKSFSGTSGRLKFDYPAREILDVIMTEGLEHHISLTYGDCLDELIALAQLLNIPILQLNK